MNALRGRYCLGSRKPWKHRHLLKLRDLDSSAPHVECVTCETGLNFTECLTFRVQPSPSLEYVILECLGPGIPWSKVLRLPSDQILLDLDDHEGLRNASVNITWPILKEFNLTLNGKEVLVPLLIPPDYMPEDELNDEYRYPILLQV